jgi:hypothetical protein
MNYCEEKGISTSKLNEAQRTLYFIAENMKMTKSISEEGYEHFQQAIKALEQESTTEEEYEYIYIGNGAYEKRPKVKSELTTKNDLGVDCISRIETIDYLCKHCPDDGECFKDCDEIKHLRQMPSVKPI